MPNVIIHGKGLVKLVDKLKEVIEQEQDWDIIQEGKSRENDLFWLYLKPKKKGE